MKPAPFTYQRPDTLAQALAAYAAEPEAKILAGGQSLIPLMSMRLATVPAIIDINGIAELAQIHVGDGGVRFGAIVRHAQLRADVDVQRVQPLIAKALDYVAHPTIRNRGTTLGSIVHADASAEMPAVLALLGGTVTATSATGERIIEAADFFSGPLESALETGEIATEAFMPSLPTRTGVGFEEVARRHGDYALCGVATVVTTDAAGAITSARAGYLSVCETPTVVDLTAAFGGGEASDDMFEASGVLALESLEPETDIHATAEYRGQLVRVLTARAIRSAYDDCRARQLETS